MFIDFEQYMSNQTGMLFLLEITLSNTILVLLQLCIFTAYSADCRITINKYENKLLEYDIVSQRSSEAQWEQNNAKSFRNCIPISNARST